jgi:hypothetical protein
MGQYSKGNRFQARSVTVTGNSNSNIHGFYEGALDYLYQRREVKLQWLQVWTDNNVKNLNVQESHIYLKNKIITLRK